MKQTDANLFKTKASVNNAKTALLHCPTDPLQKAQRRPSLGLEEAWMARYHLQLAGFPPSELPELALVSMRGLWLALKLEQIGEEAKAKISHLELY